MSGNEAGPLHNRTALNHEIYHPWMAPPKVRGTSDIIYTCVITISLCVYTAIHPNIPHPKNRHQWVNRTGWVLTGILAPEYVLWTAFTQFWEAREHVSFLNSEYAEQHQTSGTHTKPRFNLVYGFFVAMGGLRFDDNSVPESGESSRCLTVKGCRELADLGTFIEIDDDAIGRRQKANAFTKVLVCLEVLWMSIQCIARASSGLPLTLLEIHTFVHVVCALAIYGLWFKKPFDVSEALEPALKGEDENRMSLIGGLSKPSNPLRYIIRHSAEPVPGHDTCECEMHLSRIAKPDLFYQFLWGKKPPSDTLYDVASGPLDDLALHNLMERHKVTESDWTVASLSSDGDPIVFNLETIKKYQLCFVCDRILDQRRRRATLNVPRSSPLGVELLRAQASGVEKTHAPGRYADYTRQAINDWVVPPWEPEEWHGVLAIFTLSAAYGGVHLAAWRATFSSEVERILWRSSAISIAGGMVVHLGIIGAFLWLDGFRNMISPTSRRNPRKPKWLFNLMYRCVDAGMFALFIVWGILAAVYVFARIFLVVESFIQLRAVPVGVYAAIPWADYIPHI